MRGLPNKYYDTRPVTAFSCDTKGVVGKEEQQYAFFKIELQDNSAKNCISCIVQCIFHFKTRDHESKFFI